MTAEQILEDIYSVTDEWEWMPMRVPPFERWERFGVDEEDVAELIVEMQRKYGRFRVTDYPECVMDVVDMVMRRENTREKNKREAEAYERSLYGHCGDGCKNARSSQRGRVQMVIDFIKRLF